MLTIDHQTILKQFYDIDDYEWLLITIELIKNKEYNLIDFEHLLEELESLSKRDKDAISSYLELIICHLLYLQYWHSEYEYNSKHWQYEIINFRLRLELRLTTKLRNYLRDNLDDIYKFAVKSTVIKTGLNQSIFPPDCPYTLTQLLDEEWYPYQ